MLMINVSVLIRGMWAKEHWVHRNYEVLINVNLECIILMFLIIRSRKYIHGDESWRVYCR